MKFYQELTSHCRSMPLNDQENGVFVVKIVTFCKNKIKKWRYDENPQMGRTNFTSKVCKINYTYTI